jgi:hypothetical protein
MTVKGYIRLFTNSSLFNAHANYKDVGWVKERSDEPNMPHTTPEMLLLPGLSGSTPPAVRRAGFTVEEPYKASLYL